MAVNNDVLQLITMFQNEYAEAYSGEEHKLTHDISSFLFKYIVETWKIYFLKFNQRKVFMYQKATMINYLLP